MWVKWLKEPINYFKEPASPVQEGIIYFHDDLMVILLFTVVFVTTILLITVKRYSTKVKAEKKIHGPFIEVVWTVIPALLLIVISVPSFTLLYAVEDSADPSITVKVVGHQWYWSYEINDKTQVDIDSYMLPEEDLAVGELRLLEVDNRLHLPEKTHIRFIVTSSDVLHAFAVPSLGIKIDACPGRLNEVMTYIKRIGVYYGQCSELCGVNHSFMPIVVEVSDRVNYLNKWNITF